MNFVCDACHETLYRGYCRNHQLKPRERLVDARMRHHLGQIPLVVTKQDAAHRRMGCLSRFDELVQRASCVIDPRTARQHPKARCHAAHEWSPDDPGSQKSIDLGYSRYYFCCGFRSAHWIVWEMRVISRKDSFVEDGFDTAPLSWDELSSHIRMAIQQLDEFGQGIAAVVGLASITGWDNDAKSTWQKQGGYQHKNLTLLLIDLHAPAVVYHWRHQDARCATMMNTMADILSPPGELEDACANIERLISEDPAGHHYIALTDAVAALGVRHSLGMCAFHRLCAGGGFRLLGDDNSLTLIRSDRS